jgi:hypothetical protein
LLILNLKNKIFLNLRIYNGSQVSLKEACLLLASLFSRHGLSVIAQMDVYKTIKMFCPIKNNLPITYYKLMKKTLSHDYDLTTIEYCENCNEPLDKNKVCQNSNCENLSKKQTSHDCFTYTKINKQIEDIVSSNYETIISYKAKENLQTY